MEKIYYINPTSCIVNWELHHQVNKTSENTLAIIADLLVAEPDEFRIISDTKSKDNNKHSNKES